MMKSLLICVLIFSGCATSSFHGPGNLKLQGETEIMQAEDAAGPGPKVSWNGERLYTRPDEPFQFDWPLDQARLSRGFSIGGKRSHWGVDLANKLGTDILAAERGVVIYTGKGFKGYGNLIVVEHNDEWATLYSHLNEISVSEGDTVTRGQMIGKMGRTGRASGVHLHFELRHFRQPVNPMAYLPEGF